MNLIPRYSKAQKLLKSVFFEKEKTITIFTEDKPSDKILYNILLERLELDGIKIKCITPLGSKSIVIEESIRCVNSKNKRLFIVDSDIGLMNSEPINNTNLIGLDKYCIENYLCCEEGIINYLYPRLGKDKKTIKKEIKFTKEIKSNLTPLIKLYYRYLISSNLKCGDKFNNFDYFSIGNEPNKKISRSKINNEIKLIEISIKTQLKKNDFKNYDKEMKNRIKAIKDITPINERNTLTYLSGKSLIFPLVRQILIKFDKATRLLSIEQLKRLLAERININQLDLVRNKIIEITK